MSESKIVQLRPLDDSVLVARAKAGDRAAFEQLFRTHVHAVVRLLSRILGADAEVPALANNVLWVAWQRLSDLPEDTRFGAFLGGVCVNVARNRLRSRRRRRWLVFSDVGADAEPAAADPSDAREALRATYAVLATMDLDLRICFALRYIDGCELTEVARLTEVSLATIKRRLVKADAAFLKSAQMHGVLSSWVAAGTRWGGLG